MLQILMISSLGVGLLAGCDEIEDPVDSCLISNKFKGGECGKRDLNYKHRTIGDFIGETKFVQIKKSDNYVCFASYDWSVIIKPYLKKINTKYRQSQRKKK